MKKNKKFLTKLIAGIFFGTILGFIGFSKMMAYGLKHECVANTISNTICCGYDQCGSLGFIIGIIAGSLFGVIFGSFWGVIILKKLKIINYLKTICILISSAVILFFLGGVLSESWISYIDYFLIIPQVILFFILSSGITSLIIIGVINIGEKLYLKLNSVASK